MRVTQDSERKPEPFEGWGIFAARGPSVTTEVLPSLPLPFPGAFQPS